MFFSQLKTEQGGNVDMLAPGGSVIVGVPNPPAAGEAVPFTNQLYQMLVSAKQSLAHHDPTAATIALQAMLCGN